MMFARHQKWWILLGLIILVLLAFNFLTFRAAHSATESEHTLSTYQTGETLPGNMAPGFTLSIAVTGDDYLSKALTAALQAELEEQTVAGVATPVTDSPLNNDMPVLLLDLTSDRLWIPVYGHVTLTAQLFYTYDGEAPWPLDEPVVFRLSPAVKATGQFTVEDTTWGFISKPAYTKHLAQALAETVASALQNDVFVAN